MIFHDGQNAYTHIHIVRFCDVTVIVTHCFPGGETKSTRPLLAQPASSRGTIHPSIFRFVWSVSRTTPSLQGKNSQVVETQTSGRTHKRPHKCFCGYPHWPAPPLLQMQKQIKIPRTCPTSTPKPKVLGLDELPSYENST